MRKMKLLLLTVLLAGIFAVAIVTAGAAEKTIYTRGDEVLMPNTFVHADLRFSPGPTTVKSGDTLRWTHADNTPAPHTVTLATADQLVQDFTGLFPGGCPACDTALIGHFSSDPPTLVLDDGDGEFNDAGDSLLFFHGQTVSAQINAPAGTTLYYFCAIHPWMQGSIDIVGD